MIIIDSNFHEIGEADIDIDCEYGTSEDATNDFQLMNATIQDAKTAGGFYIPDTEIGGLFEYSKEKSEENAALLRGYTWRGILSHDVILPDVGEDYKIVTGEANAVISSIMAGRFGGVFSVSAEDSGLTITDYQFPLYINVLDGIEGMLESFSYKLRIKAFKSASGQPITIELSAAPATVLTGTMNNDSPVPLTYIDDNMGINHLICGGSGELQNRMIRHLYIDDQGQISQTPFYTGFKERTKFFDYPNAESESDLIDSGIKELKELASKKELGFKVPEDADLEIGDIITAVFPNGMTVQSPIVSKIYKIVGGLTSTEYKVKGEY